MNALPTTRAHPAPSAATIAGGYAATLLCWAWALLVLLGHTSTQGHAVRWTGVLLAAAPLLPVAIMTSLWAWRAHRAQPFGLRMWVSVPPVLACLYAIAGLIASLF
jgi:hypothetical protein